MLQLFVKKKGKEEDLEDTRHDVQLFANDTPWTRARNLLRVAGMVDRCNFADKMAEGIHAYMLLDAASRPTEEGE